MKKKYAYGIAAAVILSAAAMTQMVYPAQAESDQMIVYADTMAGPVEIGGMTKEEAKKAVEEYVDGLRGKKITLSLAGRDEKKIEATVADMGFCWVNQSVIDELGIISRTGNVIRRYKVQKDLEHTETVCELEFAVDKERIQSFIEANRAALEIPAVDAVLTKQKEGFVITSEQVGSTVDIEASMTAIENYLLNEWNYEDCTVTLASEVLKPALTREDCERVQSEPMAEFTTSYTSSSTARCGNIDAAVDKINGSVVLPGQRFSCLEHMVPFTAENGYFPAGSYYNGRLVDSFGGGVCQVSTTLYNAVLLAELEVNQRNNHGLTVGYVQLSSDAAIAESSGMDFIFTNDTNAPVYIEGYTENKRVTFKIYGMDERPENRSISYKSEVVEVINPPEDVVTENPALPAGAREVTQSSHTGYRAVLYKYVYIDGVQVSKEQVNSSYYAPAPNYVSVGVGTPAAEEPASEETGQESAESSPENAPSIPSMGQPGEGSTESPSSGETGEIMSVGQPGEVSEEQTAQ